MIIKYTKKTSGYVALSLAILTLKILIEAIIVGRGAVPGLSFLLYTIIFYVHYNSENIRNKTTIIFDKLYTLTKPMIQNIIESLSNTNKTVLDKSKIIQKAVRKLQNNYSKNNISSHIKNHYKKNKTITNKLIINYNTQLKKYVKKGKNKIEIIKNELHPNIIQLRTQLAKNTAQFRKNVIEAYGTIHKKWNLFINNTFE